MGFYLYRVYRVRSRTAHRRTDKRAGFGLGAQSAMHYPPCQRWVYYKGKNSGRHYLLNLTERGQEAFEAAHRIFFDWDDRFMTNLTAKEKEQLLALLEKATERIPHHVRND